MRNFYKLSVLLFACIILITGCKPKIKNKAGSKDDNSTATATSTQNNLPPITKTEDSIPHIMGTPVGNNIIGKWMIDGSDGDVVLEFLSDGNYNWLKNGKIVSRGTYTFDESQNSLEMSDKGRTEVKINGNTMTEKTNDNITLVYKRL